MSYLTRITRYASRKRALIEALCNYKQLQIPASDEKHLGPKALCLYFCQSQFFDRVVPKREQDDVNSFKTRIEQFLKPSKGNFPWLDQMKKIYDHHGILLPANKQAFALLLHNLSLKVFGAQQWVGYDYKQYDSKKVREQHCIDFHTIAMAGDAEHTLEQLPQEARDSYKNMPPLSIKKQLCYAFCHITHTSPIDVFQRMAAVKCADDSGPGNISVYHKLIADLRSYTYKGEPVLADLIPHVALHLMQTYEYHMFGRCRCPTCLTNSWSMYKSFTFHWMHGISHWCGVHDNCYYRKNCPHEGRFPQLYNPVSTKEIFAKLYALMAGVVAQYDSQRKLIPHGSSRERSARYLAPNCLPYSPSYNTLRPLNPSRNTITNNITAFQ